MKILNSNVFANSRKIMKDKFDADPDLRWAYICNIAMLLYDTHGSPFDDYNTRNETAEKLIKLIFG